MKIVLGLGNPGERYAGTRHNLGFRVVDELARRHSVAFRRRDELSDQSWTAETTIASEDVVLAKPRTFMNRSGRAGASLLRRFDLAPADLLVIHDDADLELGRVRVRPSGGAGGHNGLRSLIATLGSGEFPRIKLGVRGAGRERVDLAEYVLGEFDPSERSVVAALAALGADAVEAVLASGVESAMNAWNGKSAGGPAGG